MSFQVNIEKSAKENNFFRKVLYTGKNAQLVLMCLAPGEDIGEETHNTIDQFFYFVQGKGELVIKGKANPFSEGDAIFVPVGTLHNFRNTGTESLKLFTTYSPPNHPDGTIHETKEDAEKAEY
ncbi:MAG: cupin domain-containing protein [Candidatus Nealsonbacteria bacterium]